MTSLVPGTEPPEPPAPPAPPIPPAPPGGIPRIRTARFIAIGADVLQIVLFPAFAAGWISPLNDVLDIVVTVIMVRMVGWHFAFLPTFVAELVPGLDLFPTWTAAVWFATRGRAPSRGR